MKVSYPDYQEATLRCSTTASIQWKGIYVRHMCDLKNLQVSGVMLRCTSFGNCLKLGVVFWSYHAKLRLSVNQIVLCAAFPWSAVVYEAAIVQTTL